MYIYPILQHSITIVLDNVCMLIFFRQCRRYDYTALREDQSLPQKIRFEKIQHENELRGKVNNLILSYFAFQFQYLHHC